MTSPAPLSLRNGRASASRVRRLGDGALTLRRARPADAAALAALAAMDDAAPLREPVLVAARDGRVVAALSLADGAVAADPFARTADALALLRVRARQERGSGPARRRLGLFGRRGRARLAAG